MSIKPLNSGGPGDYHILNVEPEAGSDKRELTKKKVELAAKLAFPLVEVGMPLHEEHSHIFADYFKKVIDEMAKTRYEGEGLSINSLPMKSSTVAKYDYQPLPKDLEALLREVDIVLAQPRIDGQSIPQSIVAAAAKEKDGGGMLYPQLAKIKATADKMVGENHAILLPGGTSIHPKFYGESAEPEERNKYEVSIPRSMHEFFIINACETQGKPLLGICRGHQAIGIYYGGKLDRDSVGSFQEGKVRSIEGRGTGGLIPDMPKSAFFYHNQVLLLQAGGALDSIVKMNTAGDLRKEYEILDGNAKAMLNAMVDDPSNTELIAEAKEMINPVIQESKEKVAEVLNLLSENHIALAVERRFGAPMLGLQFHPEAVEHLSPQSEEASNFDYKGNKKIIDLFIQWAAVVARKETLLKQIKDMPQGD